MKVIHLGKSVKFSLVFLMVLFGCIFFYGSSVMSSTEKVKHSYWIVYNFENAVGDIRINGVPVYKNSGAQNGSESKPVAQLLTNGKNIITLNFIAALRYKGKPYTADKARDDFMISVRMDIMGGDGSSESIDIAYLSYDSKKDNYVSLNKSLINVEPNKLGVVAQSKQVGEITESEFITANGQKIDSFEVSFEVDVKELGLDDLRWANSKVIDLKDAKTKDKILDKYNEIIGYIRNNDSDSYVNIFHDNWSNAAHALNINGGVDYYIDLITKERLDEGMEVADFNYSSDKYRFETTYGNRLVRLLPTPIYLGEHEVEISPIFFIDMNGDVKVASVTSD